MKKLLFILLLSSSMMAQGPVDGYMKSKNSFAAGLSFSREKATKLYAGTTGIASGRTTKAYSLFGIYGITDKINAQVNIPYLDVGKGTVQDFQDLSMYLKFLVLKKDNSKGNLNIMIATGFSQPLGEYITTGGNAIGQQAYSGDGRIILQQNFKNNYFASLQGGYFLKSNPTPDAFSSSLKIGYAGNFYADVWFEVLEAFGGTDYRGTGLLQPTAARGGFRGLGFSYRKVGGTFYHSITKHIGAFGGLSYVLSGRNAFQNTGINIGVVFQ